MVLERTEVPFWVRQCTDHGFFAVHELRCPRCGAALSDPFVMYRVVYDDHN